MYAFLSVFVVNGCTIVQEYMLSQRVSTPPMPCDRLVDFCLSKLEVQLSSRLLSVLAHGLPLPCGLFSPSRYSSKSYNTVSRVTKTYHGRQHPHRSLYPPDGPPVQDTPLRVPSSVHYTPLCALRHSIVPGDLAEPRLTADTRLLAAVRLT